MRFLSESRSEIVWWDQQKTWKMENASMEYPQASYKLNNIQIVTNDALLSKRMSTEKGTGELYQSNEIKVHACAIQYSTITSVKNWIKSLSYAFHQLVSFDVTLLFSFFWQLVAPCHVVVVWTMINIFYPFSCALRSATWEK